MSCKIFGTEVLFAGAGTTARVVFVCMCVECLRQCVVSGTSTRVIDSSLLILYSFLFLSLSQDEHVSNISVKTYQ